MKAQYLWQRSIFSYNFAIKINKPLEFFNILTTPLEKVLYIKSFFYHFEQIIKIQKCIFLVQFPIFLYYYVFFIRFVRRK